MSPKEFYTDADVIALVKAAQRDDIDEIDRLVDKGVDVNAKGKDDFTSLLFALQAKNKPGFLRLLERGADPNIQNDRGQSVMSFVALAKDDSEWLEMVLKHKGNPNLVRASDDIVVGRQTPIFNAIRSQNTRNVELLIKAGAHLNHQGKSGDTPVMYAALSKRYQAAFLLLQAGADWKAQD